MLTKTKLRGKEKAVVAMAVVAIAFLGMLAGELLVYAQELPVVVTTTTTNDSNTISGLLNQVNTAYVAVSGVIAIAIAIATGVINWIRRVSGDKLISDHSNEWLQWVFENARETDEDIKDTFKKAETYGSRVDVVVDVLKESFPEFKAAYDKAAPKIAEAAKKVKDEADDWEKQLDRIYEVSPKADPVGSSPAVPPA